MADRGIIFSAPMVRALLEGRKAQTRLALSPQPEQNIAGLWLYPPRSRKITAQNWKGFCQSSAEDVADFIVRTGQAPYATGDRLYVREAWRTADAYDDLPPRDLGGEEAIRYEVDGHVQTWGWPESGPIGRYRHARFMPRWASRLTVIVTDVRVLRLQEIREADARAEGVDDRDPICGYSELWDSLHGPEAWAANPWVCALTFTVHRCNIDQMPGGGHG